MRARTTLFLCAVLGLTLGCGTATAPRGFDPVVSDPPFFDAEHPPRLFDALIPIEGEPVTLLLYEAQGPGPHPTALLLHGFPGFEKNLDLAQSIRRAGWNVVFFHYRGSWGSGGRWPVLYGQGADPVSGVSARGLGLAAVGVGVLAAPRPAVQHHYLLAAPSIAVLSVLRPEAPARVR